MSVTFPQLSTGSSFGSGSNSSIAAVDAALQTAAIGRHGSRQRHVVSVVAGAPATRPPLPFGTVASIPEPGELALLGVGLVGLRALHRRGKAA